MPAFLLKNLPSYLEPIAKTSALVAGVLYVSGFLIINSYLAKYGLNDYNVISSRFIFSGTSFFLACAIWWIVCGRLYFYKDLTEINLHRDYSRLHKTIALLAHASHLISRSYAASLTICFVMFGSGFVVFPGLVLISLLLFADVLVGAMRSDTSKSSLPFVISRLSLTLASIVIFYIMFRPSDDVFALAHLILSLEAVALPLGDAIKENKLLDLKPFVSPLYYTLMIIFYMASFGNKFYDKIRPTAGGGLSHIIMLAAKDPISLGGIISGPNNLLAGLLLYMNEKMLVVMINGKVLIVPSDQVKASIVDTTVDKLLSYRMTKTVRRLGIPWKYDPFGQYRSIAVPATNFSLKKKR